MVRVGLGLFFFEDWRIIWRFWVLVDGEFGTILRFWFLEAGESDL